MIRTINQQLDDIDKKVNSTSTTSEDTQKGSHNSNDLFCSNKSDYRSEEIKSILQTFSVNQKKVSRQNAYFPVFLIKN